MRAYEVRETTGLDGLHLNRDRGEPTPGHGQVLVHMRAAALNYRDQGAIGGRPATRLTKAHPLHSRGVCHDKPHASGSV
jgi:NADPH:quinone reductase-like Zn-dependent oxidoreductase